MVKLTVVQPDEVGIDTEDTNLLAQRNWPLSVTYRGLTYMLKWFLVDWDDQRIQGAEYWALPENEWLRVMD